MFLKVLFSVTMISIGLASLVHSAPGHKANAKDVGEEKHVVTKAEVIQIATRAVRARDSKTGAPVCEQWNVQYIANRSAWDVQVMVRHIKGHARSGKPIFAGDVGQRSMDIDRYGKLRAYYVGD